MKKLLILGVGVTLLFSLVGCGNSTVTEEMAADVEEEIYTTVEKEEDVTEVDKADEYVINTPESIDGQQLMDAVQNLTSEEQELKNIVSMWFGTYYNNEEWIYFSESNEYMSMNNNFIIYNARINEDYLPLDTLEFKSVDDERIFELKVRDDMVIDATMVTDVVYEKAEALSHDYKPYPVIYFKCTDKDGRKINGKFFGTFDKDGIFLNRMYIDVDAGEYPSLENGYEFNITYRMN